MDSQHESSPPSGGRSRRSGRGPSSRQPAGDEPPVLVDPRRGGALIGIVGGLVFVFSYAPPLGRAVFLAAGIVGVALALTALLLLYLRPTSLGSFREPTRTALLVYVCCVVGELVAIAVGSRLLLRVGHADLRPALIAAVVGVHFLPFAWAFGERMFYRLGLVLVVLGCVGLAAGWAGLPLAAGAAAVLSGLAMLALIVQYGRGHFARRPPGSEAAQP